MLMIILYKSDLLLSFFIEKLFVIALIVLYLSSRIVVVTEANWNSYSNNSPLTAYFNVTYAADYISDDSDDMDNDYDYDPSGLMMDEDLDAVLEEVEKDIGECSACQHFATK